MTITSTDTHDQSEIVKYLLEIQEFVTVQESTYFSVEIEKWKKYYENIPFEEGPATANSAFVSCLKPSDIPCHSQDPYNYHSSCYHHAWAVFLVNALFCSEACQIVE